MANSFTKQETVLFDRVFENMADGLVMTKNLSVMDTDPTEMERASNIMWIPMEYSFGVTTGTHDATGNFQDKNLLSVPATTDMKGLIPLATSLTEGRDPLQDTNAQKAAGKKLASDINRQVMARVNLHAGLTIKRTSAAASFDDVAVIKTLLDDIGAPTDGRVAAYATRDYLGLAKDLAGRQTLSGVTQTAYERAMVGNVAGMDIMSMDTYTTSTAAAGSGITMDTRSSASNYLVPAPMQSSGGIQSPKDNRFQQITVSSTTNVAAGDRFSIAGVTWVHRLTKDATSQSSTHTVVSVDSATTMTITPPIISAQGGAQIETQYKNVSVSGSGSATAALTFLNTTLAPASNFWVKDAVVLLPGRLSQPAGAGAALTATTTDNGIELHMMKQVNAITGVLSYVFRTFFGVCVKDTSLAGRILFSQA